MISKLRGQIIHKELSSIVLDVNGVGYKINLTPETVSTLVGNNEANLFVHLAVRENSLDLYGFLTKEELDFYELLLTVSGIGPKSGLGILSVASVEMLRGAISTGDTSYLTKVSGIGKKSADKIVLELRDKLGKVTEFDSISMKEESDVVETLKMLGYKPNEIREAIKEIPKDTTGTSNRVKEALKFLGK